MASLKSPRIKRELRNSPKIHLNTQQISDFSFVHFDRLITRRKLTKLTADRNGIHWRGREGGHTNHLKTSRNRFRSDKAGTSKWQMKGKHNIIYRGSICRATWRPTTAVSPLKIQSTQWQFSDSALWIIDDSTARWSNVGGRGRGGDL